VTTFVQRPHHTTFITPHLTALQLLFHTGILHNQRTAMQFTNSQLLAEARIWQTGRC